MRSRVRSFVTMVVLSLLVSAAGVLVVVEPAAAAFPGNNGVIAFTSNRDVAAGEIYTMTTGGVVTRLTFSNGSSDPAFSPDGSRIAFVSGGTGGYQIFVMNADGSGRRQVTTTSTAKSQPNWSPDGTQIAFVANSGDVDGQTDPEIWSINDDGTDRRQLTNNTHNDQQPVWSPLGDRIAFVTGRSGDTDRNVYVMNADGTNEVSLTPNSPAGCSSNCYQGHDDAPAWSPDGSTIAYVHNHTTTGGGGPDIWIVGANGGARTNLSNNNATSELEPAWSPDGSQIAFRGLASDNNSNIYLMNADGSNQRPIETHVALDKQPDWQPIAQSGDVVSPTVTINQAPEQADPTSASPILFGVVFSEPVTGFANDDVALSSTAGATTALVTGSGANYTVSVSGMTTSGSVSVMIPTGAATDAAGNASLASTSSDNTVSFMVTNSAPVVTAPSASLGTGQLPFVTLNGAPTVHISVKLAWSATDPDGISQYEIQQSINGGAFSTIKTLTFSSPLTTNTAKTLTLKLLPGRTYQFQVRATDATGQASSFVAGSSFPLTAVQDTGASGASSYSGSWTTVTVADAFGGTVKQSATSGNTVTYTFTGTAVSWITTKGATMGQVEVWLDGVKVKSKVDLYAATPTARFIGFSKSGMANTTHILVIKVLPTKNASSTGTNVQHDAVVILQ